MENTSEGNISHRRPGEPSEHSAGLTLVKEGGRREEGRKGLSLSSSRKQSSGEFSVQTCPSEESPSSGGHVCEYPHHSVTGWEQHRTSVALA